MHNILLCAALLHRFGGSYFCSTFDREIPQMRISKHAAVIAGATACFGLTSVASAQLLVGVDDATVPAFLYDFSGGVSPAVVPTPISLGLEHWGLDADDASERLFTQDGTALTTLTYADVLDGGTTNGTTVTTNVGGTAISMVGLTYGNGVLYGVRNIGGDTGLTPEAIYSIDPATGNSVLAVDYDSTLYDFGGLGFANGLIYATNDDHTGTGDTTERGLYTIDPTSGTITFVAAYPGSETDLDGLAVGGGYAFLVGDGPAGDDIYPFNLSTGQYEATIPSPFAAGEVFSGAAWAPGLIPEPTTASLLALGALGLLRRRR